jgi:hypothetical protein
MRRVIYVKSFDFISQFPADRFGKESLVIDLIELCLVRHHEVLQHLLLETPSSKLLLKGR